MKTMNLKTINLLLITLQIFTLLYFGIRINRLKVSNCTDYLTKLYNRQQYNKEVINAISKLGGANSHLSLVIIDIDDFKSVNDTWGHLVGDKVLKNVASIIKNNIRTYDIAIRWGGEEFVLILPNTNKDGAYILCERIRRLIETSSCDDASVTVSIGISCVDKNIEPDNLLDKADKELYKAKKRKNFVSIMGGENEYDFIREL